MDDNIQRIRNRIPFDFEDHFNYKNISPEQISFARHYTENIMGIDLDSYSSFEFSSISPTVFGYLIAHIALEYEKYIKSKPETGFNTKSPG
jgi:hypothetical protein